MFGQETGILSLAFALAGMVTLAGLLAWGWLAERRYHAERHHWYCSRMGKDVDLVHVRMRGGTRWLGVRSCSAFGDPEHVTCDQTCVAKLNAGLVRRVPGEPAVAATH